MQPIVAKINAYEPTISALTDEQLAAKTNEFREQIAQGKSLDAILPEAFAVVREALSVNLANGTLMFSLWVAWSSIMVKLPK